MSGIKLIIPGFFAFSSLCIAAMLSLAMISCANNTEETAEEVLRPVRTMLVFTTGGERTRVFTGSAQAGTESRISFKVGGTIESLNVKVGDRISRNTLIAELDSSDYQLAVQQAEASLQQANAQRRNARASFERVRALYENNNATLNDYDSARAAKDSAEAAVESFEKQLDMAKLRVTYCKLFAPSSGTVSAVDVEVNEHVDVGKPIIVMISGAKPEVRVGVPELFISQISEGDAVEVTFDAIPDRSFPAYVTEVGVSTSQLTSTYPVTVELVDSNTDIRSGMAAEVEFTFENISGEEKIIVPASSVEEDRKGKYVFLVEPADDDTGIVHRQSVEVGDIGEQGIEIIAGISNGDLLVIAGMSKMSEGLKVKLMPDQGNLP